MTLIGGRRQANGLGVTARRADAGPHHQQIVSIPYGEVTPTEGECLS